MRSPARHLKVGEVLARLHNPYLFAYQRIFVKKEEERHGVGLNRVTHSSVHQSKGLLASSDEIPSNVNFAAGVASKSTTVAFTFVKPSVRLLSPPERYNCTLRTKIEAFGMLSKLEGVSNTIARASRVSAKNSATAASDALIVAKSRSRNSRKPLV